MNYRLMIVLVAGMGAMALLLIMAGHSFSGYDDIPGFFDDRSDQAEVVDAIDIQVLDDKLLAIQKGETIITESLRLDELVLVKKTKGLVGLAVTTDRLLAISTTTANWIEEPLKLTEVRREKPRAFVADFIILVVTVNRLLGFNAKSGNWVETDIPLYDTVIRAEIDRNVAVVITTQRAWGFAVGSPFFSSINFLNNEEIISVETSPQNVNILTDKRLLVFKSVTASWQEIDKELY